MPKLKTTSRGMNKPTFTPDKVAVGRLLDMLSNPEVAEYAAAKMTARLSFNEGSKPLVKQIQEFAINALLVRAKQAEGSIWTGKGSPLTDFTSLQRFLAEQATTNLKELLQNAGQLTQNGELQGELELDFAVNDNAQFVRGYKLNGESVTDKAMAESLDDMFKAWLAEKGMFYKNGQLYEVDEKGKIKQTANGQDILMQKEEIFNRLQDSNNGFASYLSKQGIQTQVNRRAFPEAEPKVEHKEEATAAIKSGKKPEGIADAEGVEVKPEAEEPTKTGPASST